MTDILAELDENTTIGELLDTDPRAARILQEFGMHCLSCRSARYESLADAAAVHDVNVYELLDQLLTYFAEQQDGQDPLTFPMF